MSNDTYDNIDEDDEVSRFLMSEEFQKSFAEIVNRDTWERGLPKSYLDKDGNLIHHWKDGRIDIIKTKEELKNNK